MSFPVLFLILFFVGVVSVIITPWPRKPTFRLQQIQTPNEIEFFGRLVRALPNHFVFPQVSMGAFLDPVARNRKTRVSHFFKICSKRVDYAICDRNHILVAIIELDDRSHVTANDKIRDAMVATAGICTIRFESRNRPSDRAIAEAVSKVSNVNILQDRRKS
jgi:very-short-patch-repair endonuclease